MADPITVYDHNHQGHIVTIFGALTGAAGVATITIADGYPAMDLSKAHPVISGCCFATEGDTITNCEALLPAAEIARSSGDAPDTVGEWQIKSSTTIEVKENNKDGNYGLCYWAAGNKQT